MSRSSPSNCSAGRRKLTRNDKLHAYWSKRERDVILYSPLGQQTTCDGAFLAGVFNKAFTDELERRGYDVSTLRFSIAPKQGNERFASQRQNTQLAD